MRIRLTYHANQSPFYELKSRRRLSALLGLSEPELRQLLQRQDLYKEWDELTRKGKLRHIENPCHALKSVQKRIARLLGRITPPHFLYCPVKKRSYITNAARHIGNPVVRTLDIRDYFRSTLARRVYWFFHSCMRCSSDVAAVLRNLSTINDHLPTGSPLSPILSYFAHIDMWEAIDRIAAEAKCVLTVYMDDLTISGARISDAVMWRIRQQIDRCGLEYHKEKFYRNVPAEITGVIVRKKGLALPNRRQRLIYELRKRIQTVSDEDKEDLLKKLRGYEGEIVQIHFAYSNPLS